MRRSRFEVDREASANRPGHVGDRCAPPCNAFPPPLPEIMGMTIAISVAMQLKNLTFLFDVSKVP